MVASTMPGSGEDDLDVVALAATARNSPERRTGARRSGRRSPARPRRADRSACSARSCRGTRTWRWPRTRRGRRSTLAGTAMAATSRVSLMAATRIGLGDGGQIGAEPGAEAPRRTPQRAAAAETARGRSPRRRSETTRTGGRSVVTAGPRVSVTRSGAMAASVIGRTSAAPGLHEMHEQQDARRRSSASPCRWPRLADS